MRPEGMNQYIQGRIDEIKEEITSASGTKYDCSGIYCIYIDDKLVYIGKSNDLKTRIANHIYNTESGNKEHKYYIFRQALQTGHNIRFDKLQRCDNKENISDLEGYWIRHYLPPLNYQIPKEENSKKYSVNKNAKYISLAEILAS